MFPVAIGAGRSRRDASIHGTSVNAGLVLTKFLRMAFPASRGHVALRDRRVGADSGWHELGCQLSDSPADLFLCCKLLRRSVDVQVNACLADALSVGGTCDARGVTGNVAAVITVGNSSYNPVRLILPDSGTWTCTGTGGSNPCILQYVGSSIVGPLKIGGAPPFTIAAGGSSNLDYVYTTIAPSLQ